MSEREDLEREAGEGEVDAMFGLGLLEESEGDRVAARSWFEKAAAVGDPSALTKLGVYAEAAGAIDEAESLYSRARSYWQAGGDNYGDGFFAGGNYARFAALFRLALLAARSGDHERARLLFGELAVEIADEEIRDFGIDAEIETACSWFAQRGEVDEVAASKALAEIAGCVSDDDGVAEWLRNAARLSDREAMLALADHLGGGDEARHLRERVWSDARVCVECLVYSVGDNCPTCWESDGLVEQSDLSPTQHVLLWINTEGQGDEVVWEFARAECDWDKVKDDEVGAVATWSRFLDFLRRTGRADLACPGGTRLDDPGLGRWVLDERLFEIADTPRGID